MDKEIAQNLKLILKKRGVESHTSAAVQGVHMEGDTCVCTFVEKKKKEQTVEVEYVLCAVGRCPNTDGLFAEGAAPDMERGRVLVNDKFSSIPGVYVIGDLIFGYSLPMQQVHRESLLQNSWRGKEPSVNLDVVPGCVYTDPEIASAGITEDAAKNRESK